MRKKFKTPAKTRKRAREYMACRRREHPIKVRRSRRKSREKRWREARAELQAQERAARARYRKNHPQNFRRAKKIHDWREWMKRHRTRRNVSFEQYCKNHPRKPRKFSSAAARKRHNSRMFKRWALRDRKKDPTRHILRRTRCRAKGKGIKFSITREDLLVNGKLPKKCPALGLRLIYTGRNGGGKGSFHPRYASVDRIRNSRGYVPGNVIVVSLRANQIKRDATLAELRKIADFYGKSY